MNIVILGAGDVGRHLAESLSTRQHNIGIIDMSEALVEELNERLDAHVVCGNGASAAMLAEANVAEADLFLGLTSDDNVNLVGASLARTLGARKTIARVHARLQREEWLFDYKAHFKIDYLFSTERLAAVELAKHVRNPEGLLVEEIARGRIEFQQARVPAGSRVTGQPLKSLALPGRVRIGSIQRGARHFIPGGQDEIQEGDLVTVFGDPRRVAEVVGRLDPDHLQEGDVSVVIFGGGDYGFSLAQMLEGPRHAVRILERDPRVCRQIAEQLRTATVIHGNGTSLQQLKEERVGEAEFFIAASADDEDNVMACLQAKNLGTRYCVALIHRADYAEVVTRNSEQLQIKAAVSPRLTAGRDLMRFVTTDRCHAVIQLEGGVRVMEAVIRPDSALAGRRVAEVTWPEGAGLVALLHGSEALVPGGEDRMEAGDMIYAMVTEGADRGLERLLA